MTRHFTTLTGPAFGNKVTIHPCVEYISFHKIIFYFWLFFFVLLGLTAQYDWVRLSVVQEQNSDMIPVSKEFAFSSVHNK